MRGQEGQVRRLYGRNMGRLLRRVFLLQIGAALMLFNVATWVALPSALAQAAPADKPIKIVAFGDSLTAGYQLPPNEAFPVVLTKALEARGHKVEILNAGVSGDTTAAARDRIAWAVPADTEAVILEFGANDALRGLDPAKARDNLEAIIATIKGQGADVLLAGMVAPRSMGEPYTKPFDAIFPALAEKHGLLLYPLFIEAIALKPELNLADGLHPNAKGVAAIVAGILPKAEELIARVKARRLVKG
jgi:acyl-CoA thioesterase I